MTPELQKRSDEELARQTQAGSLLAFEELVHRYGKRIFGFTAHACGSNDPEEVTQQTFVRAFQSIAQFDCRREFAPWLFTLARRITVDHHRRRFRTQADGSLAERVDYDDPSELLARREECRSFWNLAQQRLPEIQFQALWLRYAEEMKVAQVAAVLGKTRTHVKVLLFRARQALASELTASHPSSQPAAPPHAAAHPLPSVAKLCV